MTKGLCERKWNKVAPISKVFGAQDVSGNVLCTVAGVSIMSFSFGNNRDPCTVAWPSWPIGMMVHAAQ